MKTYGEFVTYQSTAKLCHWLILQIKTIKLKLLKTPSGNTGYELSCILF